MFAGRSARNLITLGPRATYLGNGEHRWPALSPAVEFSIHAGHLCILCRGGMDEPGSISQFLGKEDSVIWKRIESSGALRYTEHRFTDEEHISDEESQDLPKTKLTRLISLLETGSTQHIRFTAAQQLADIQKAHPEDLFSLLTKVVPYLRHKTWDTRIAASR